MLVFALMICFNSHYFLGVLPFDMNGAKAFVQIKGC